MVRAAEVAGITRIRSADLHPPVPAHVEQDMYLSVLVPDNDKAVVDDPAQHVIPAPGNLAFVSQKDPTLREDLLYLEVEEVWLVDYLRE